MIETVYEMKPTHTYTFKKYCRVALHTYQSTFMCPPPQLQLQKLKAMYTTSTQACYNDHSGQ